jgi:hypothetical protein
MEHLTKQQIVLVTLLVSFVTSIATGIVTVSLMDQAPKIVPQTINRVVERTIERVVPNQNQAALVADAASIGNGSGASIKIQDELADSVDKSAKSLVRIKKLKEDGSTEKITGFGIVVSKDGVIVTDKSTVSNHGDYSAVFSDNTEIPVQMFQSQNNGDIAFLIVRPKTQLTSSATTSSTLFKPVSFVTSPLRLGETVFAIGGDTSLKLTQGFVSSVETSKAIPTSIKVEDVVLGSPLISSSGEFVGIKTASLDTDSTAMFYPLSLIKSAIPKEGTFK